MDNDDRARRRINLASGAIASRGVLVPDPATWASVYGLFETVVSFLCEDGYLVSLLDSSVPMEARALRCKPGAFSELRKSAVLGSSVFVEIDGWTSVPIWAQEFPALPDASAVASGLSVLGSTLAEYRELGSLCGTGIWARKFAELKNRRDFPACVAGMGPGTTPAGDDFIAGWLLAEHVCNPLDRTPVPDSVFGKTSPAGRTLLYQCLQGQFPELYLEFARAFVSGSKDMTEQAATAVTRHGATSGFDALFGFYTRLAGEDGLITGFSATA